MHLGRVLTLAAEYVDDIAVGTHLLVFPDGDLGDGFVAVLAPFQPVAVEDDVCSEEFRVRHEARAVFVDHELADEDLVFRLDDLEHLGLGLHALAGGGDHHAHLVAVEGMH